MDAKKKFINRLKIAADKVGSQAMLAQKAGLSPSVVSKYMNGGSEPDRQRLVDIATAANVDVGWLAGGHGTDEVTGPEIHMLPFYTNKIAIASSDQSIPFQERLEHRETPYPVSSYFLSNILGAKDTQNIGVFIIHGDCMVPTLKPEEVVIVNLAEESIADGIYLVVYGGGIHYRRIHLSHNGGIELKYDNADMYPAEHISDEDFENLEVVGRVIWHGRKM